MQAAGLTATELGAVLAELDPVLRQATVRDVARLDGNDDLLLFLDHPEGRRALHIAPGGRRARITFTRRRFRKAAFQSGPLIDRLRQRLLGCSFGDLVQPAGERSCALGLVGPDGDPGGALHVELFGARGLWCLVDASGDILELSRIPEIAGRELRPGATYTAPPPRESGEEPSPRFAPPVLDGVDAFFNEYDGQQEFALLQKKLGGAIDRATRRLQNKIDGLARQRKQVERIPEMRRQADMLLAYGFSQPPGATSLTVPDPDDPEGTITLALDPAQPVQTQADKLYRKARKLADGADVAARRQADAEAELEPVVACRDALAACHDFAELQSVHDRLAELGLLPKQKAAKPTPVAKDRALQKATKGQNFRRFTSREGYPILVGRSNRDNDRLSVAVARGNDLWFHVGRGYAGSHVVIRLPKGKTASLESLLDAATLAHYYSKARELPRCEVIYTQAKNVRKPKGLPPGRVTTSRTKTLIVDREAERLQRLLGSAGA